jgi:type IV pilus assembly protein PilA
MNVIKKGFTLIELMIVVAIVAILAAIALPAYQDYIGRSQMSEGFSLASGLKPNVAEYYATFGTHCTGPGNAAGQCGIAAATSIAGKYVAQTAVAAGVITATMKGAGISSCAQGKTITLTPTSPAANLPIAWGCDSNSLCKPSSCTPLVP